MTLPELVDDVVPSLDDDAKRLPLAPFAFLSSMDWFPRRGLWFRTIRIIVRDRLLTESGHATSTRHAHESGGPIVRRSQG
jgi:hypothetical protein